MAVSAVNMFRLRPGVALAEFERFSAELDRPVCLAFDVVLSFDVFFVDDPGPGGADVIEVMTVTSWPGWQQLLAQAPELEPVLARFGELVDPDSVTTILTRPSALPQEI
ncbi:hypothetical protein [Mycolicibacterium obuense]|uniref:REDY-like protein HapK n=1 Tax=Mycolicibacterium obuense TaxID=1807 RepID=A0A0J6VFR9_9MYCO|nr:hypothetical protein [Mycolicibacterium obuense]KMO68457.1 hypothetical protein MOBUDSM44075_05459 [Mycolicibacterium obuense]